MDVAIDIFVLEVTKSTLFAATNTHLCQTPTFVAKTVKPFAEAEGRAPVRLQVQFAVVLKGIVNVDFSVAATMMVIVVRLEVYAVGMAPRQSAVRSGETRIYKVVSDLSKDILRPRKTVFNYRMIYVCVLPLNYGEEIEGIYISMSPLSYIGT